MARGAAPAESLMTWDPRITAELLAAIMACPDCVVGNVGDNYEIRPCNEHALGGPIPLPEWGT